MTFNLAMCATDSARSGEWLIGACLVELMIHWLRQMVLWLSRAGRGLISVS